MDDHDLLHMITAERITRRGLEDGDAVTNVVKSVSFVSAIIDAVIKKGRDNQSTGSTSSCHLTRKCILFVLLLLLIYGGGISVVQRGGMQTQNPVLCSSGTEECPRRGEERRERIIKWETFSRNLNEQQIISRDSGLWGSSSEARRLSNGGICFAIIHERRHLYGHLGNAL